MIEDSKIVKEIRAKAGGKSGTYWSVTWTDGKSDNIFDSNWIPLCEISQKENRALKFTKEKTPDGKFYNMKTLELAIAGNTTFAPLPQPPPPPTEKTSKGELTSDDIRIRSMSISYSKDLAVAGKIEIKDIKIYADKFLNWILGKEG